MNTEIEINGENDMSELALRKFTSNPIVGIDATDHLAFKCVNCGSQCFTTKVDTILCYEGEEKPKSKCTRIFLLCKTCRSAKRSQYSFIRKFYWPANSLHDSCYIWHQPRQLLNQPAVNTGHDIVK